MRKSKSLKDDEMNIKATSVAELHYLETITYYNVVSKSMLCIRKCLRPVSFLTFKGTVISICARFAYKHTSPYDLIIISSCLDQH